MHFLGHPFFFASFTLPNTILEAKHSLYTLLLREYVESLVNITELSTSFTRLGVASKSGEFSLMLKYEFLIIKQTQVSIKEAVNNQSIHRNQTWLGLLEKVTKSPKSLVFLKPTKSIPLQSCWLSVSDDSEKLSGPGGWTRSEDLYVSRSLLRVGRLRSKSDLWFLLSAWVFSRWMCLGSFCCDRLFATTWGVGTSTGAVSRSLSRSPAAPETSQL